MVSFDKDDRVGCILLRSNLDKAFCAGGDIISMVKQQLADTYVPTDSNDPNGVSAEVSASLAWFFRLEHGLFLTMSTLSKPTISLMRGLVFGGGAGLSMACTYRIAVEKMSLSMPETAIGLFPDVSASYWMTRANLSLGRYLGVTGTRVNGADVARLGFASHYTSLADVPSVVASLRSVCLLLGDFKSDALGGHLPPSVLRRLLVNGVLSACTIPSPYCPFAAVSVSELSANHRLLPPPNRKSLVHLLPLIAQSFGGKTYTQTHDTLTQWSTSEEHDRQLFATHTLQTLAQMSPLSVVLTYQLFSHSSHTFQDWLQQEYVAITRVCRGDYGNKDLVRGVDAKLISKHNNPVWCDWRAIVDNHAHRLTHTPTTVEEAELALAALILLPLTGNGHVEKGLLDDRAKL